MLVSNRDLCNITPDTSWLLLLLMAIRWLRRVVCTGHAFSWSVCVCVCLNVQFDRYTMKVCRV